VPKLKICGVKTPEEAKDLKDAGVEYIGLNFVPTSPRRISLEQAQAIMAVLNDSDIKTVALFQDQPIEMVSEYVRELGVDYVQLHGGEPAEYARSVAKHVIKAIAVNPDASADEIIKYIKDYPADYFVLDRHEQGKGDIVDLKLAQQVIEAYPGKIYLAGGLTPDNLAEVLSKVQPYGIDISSGVRTGDTIDASKLSHCLKIIRSTAPD
jgi:phosphoribosylanthranilate isomerase